MRITITHITIIIDFPDDHDVVYTQSDNRDPFSDQSAFKLRTSEFAKEQSQIFNNKYNQQFLEYKNYGEFFKE